MDQLGYISNIYKEKTYDKPLSRVTNNVLRLFVKKKGTSAYQCYKYLKAEYEEHGKTISYKNVYKRIKRLHSHKLIEFVTSKNYEEIKHGAKYYRLTPLGIFYMFDNDIVNDNVIISEYPDDKLFKFFLYPYINSKTVISLTDNFIINNIISYLSKCCKRISGYYWPRIMDLKKRQFAYKLEPKVIKTRSEIKNSFDLNKLIKHLNRLLDLSWLNDESYVIKTIEKNRKIKIINGKKELILNIYTERLEAVIHDNDKNIFKFKLVRTRANRYELGEYRRISFVEFLSSTSPAIDSGIIGILNELCLSILEYNLWHPFNDYANEIRSNNIEMLKKDYQFINLINSFKIQIDNHCRNFIKQNE